MAQLVGTSKVTPIFNTPFLLDDLLRPFWKCLRYIGFQHGFLGPMEERRVFYILRCVSTTLIILSIFNLGIFQLVGLLRNIQSKEISNAFVLHGISMSLFMMSLVFFLTLYWRHDNLIEFFQEWKHIEAPFHQCSNRNRTENLATFFKRVLKFVVSFFLPIYFWNLTEPNLPIFFTSIGFLREIFGLHFLPIFFAAVDS